MTKRRLMELLAPFDEDVEVVVHDGFREKYIDNLMYMWHDDEACAHVAIVAEDERA